VPGGGIALLNASTTIQHSNIGEKILLESIRSPFKTILSNANITEPKKLDIGKGVNVVTGEIVDMIKSGIIDPVLVTKSALKNAISVVTTIVSADCVISNRRVS
jgi:chaperonin GroEL